MNVFRILHISDLHIGEKANRIGWYDWMQTGFTVKAGKTLVTSHDQNMLNGLADFIYRLSDQSECILITGDLATTGNEEDLENAYNFLYGTPKRRSILPIPFIRPMSSSIPIRFLPGNHDRYKRYTCFPGDIKFNQVFDNTGTIKGNYGNGWGSDEPVHRLHTSLKGDTYLAIVSADLTLREARDVSYNLPRMLGCGKVYDDVIKKLEAETTYLRQAAHKKSQAIGIVWAIHFPPAFPNIHSSLELIDESLIIDAAKRNNINIILSGHTHEEKIYKIPNTSITVLCAGSSGQFKINPQEKRTIHTIDFLIDTAGNMSIQAVQTYIWPNNGHTWLQQP